MKNNSVEYDVESAYFLVIQVVVLVGALGNARMCSPDPLLE